ncbi:MAG: amino acid adenylation domain-containing protein [Candidatus Magnetomorum sp.]|nr:amino acid adenylation domain-containing protein [Candidatus Magnetomorum sp.]
MNKKIIHSVFEKTVERYASRIAVEENNRSVEYAALNKCANRLAHALNANGVKRKSVVSVFLPNSIEFICSVIGVFKSGGILLPVDIDVPEKRFEKILNNTRPKVMITNVTLKENLIQKLSVLNLLGKIDCIIVLDEGDTINKGIQEIRFSETEKRTITEKRYPENNLPLISEPDDGNYIVYTSGSTGEPKAILGSHKNLSHFIHWEIDEFGLDENIRVSQLSLTTVDVIFRDIFTPLISGGTVCIPGLKNFTNIKYLLRWIETSKITLIHTVPSLFRLIYKEIETLFQTEQVSPKELYLNLKYILLVGEELYSNDVVKWMDIFEKRIELVNLYGATETLAKVFYRIKEKPYETNKIVPLGKPITKTAVLILNDSNELCRVGEIGQIHIKSPFLTKGYYNHPELTENSFIQNPLNTESIDIIYKTGDLGRYLSDRSIEFIGRLDRQVKINALRIELTEIEQVIMTYDKIEQTLIIAHKTQDFELRLICYYTEKDKINTTHLREYLLNILPSYMMPSFFVLMDDFPLNINGKIDKKALPKPEEVIYEDIKYVSPVDDTEEKLAEIWGEVLNLKKVGVNNSFFQIGGNSLSALRIISKIYQTFETEINIKDFFEKPTIRELTTLINQSRKKIYAPIQSVDDNDLLSDEDLAILQSLVN